jgi:hypothetical protein
VFSWARFFHRLDGSEAEDFYLLRLMGWAFVSPSSIGVRASEGPNVIAVAKIGVGRQIVRMDSYLHPVQIEAWQGMTFEEKWALSRGAQRMVRNAARNRIRRHHPDWSPEQVEKELAQFCARGRT